MSDIPKLRWKVEVRTRQRRARDGFPTLINWQFDLVVVSLKGEHPRDGWLIEGLAAPAVDANGRRKLLDDSGRSILELRPFGVPVHIAATFEDTQSSAPPGRAPGDLIQEAAVRWARLTHTEGFMIAQAVNGVQQFDGHVPERTRAPAPRLALKQA